jgi:hypothetical protein
MPLLASPNRGYADWQRIQNYDSGSLLSVSRLLSATPVLLPAIDVSRYLAIGGTIDPANAAMLVTFNWYLDVGLTELVGTRSMTIDVHFDLPPCFRLPNLGPFLQLTVQTLGGVGQVSVSLFATNREAAYDLVPQTPTLLNEIGVTIAGGASGTFYPSCPFCGPAELFVYGPESYEWAINVLTVAPSYTNFAFGAQAGGDPINQIVLLPFSACNVTVTNASGTSAAYDVVLVPSTSGSS